ncbi:MAG: type I 3-dehydroquinate dehydratase, partial [Methanobacteriota archaeon]
TLRTVAEGGRFDGSTDQFLETLEPLVRPGDLVDIETGQAAAAPRIRHLGAGVIASYHGASMPVHGELMQIAHRLRGFGDIPKIVVTPGSEHDVLDLCSFTLAARRPISTGVMGSRYRYARALLPLFGSDLVYSHAGRPTAEGQYHIADFRRIWSLLVP